MAAAGSTGVSYLDAMKSPSFAAEGVRGHQKPSSDKAKEATQEAGTKQVMKQTTAGSTQSKPRRSKCKGSSKPQQSATMMPSPGNMSPLSVVSQADNNNVQADTVGATPSASRSLRTRDLVHAAQNEDNPPLSYDSTRRSALKSLSSTSRTSATWQRDLESSGSAQPSGTRKYSKLPISISPAARPTSVPLILSEMPSPAHLNDDQCMSPGILPSPRKEAFSPQGVMSPSEFLCGKQIESQSFVAYGPEQKEMLFSYCAVSLTVIAFCALLTALLFLTVPADPQDIVCTTASCAALDALLAASVDRNRPPCTNFYAHVCGGWSQSHNVSVYNIHLHEFLGDAHWVLARVLVPSKGQTAAQVVAAFYQSCTAVLVDGADELAPFRQQLQKAGVTWPRIFARSNLMLTVASVYATFQVTALLRIRSAIRNSSNMLDVAPDETFLRGWLRTRDQLLRSGAYARFFDEAKAKYAGSEASPGRLLGYESFVRIEEVVLTTLVRKGRIAGESGVRNIEDLAQLTRNVSVTTWRKVVEKLGLSQSAHVFIANFDYIRLVDALLTRVGGHLLHYYFGWCVVQQIRRYINQDLANSWYDYDGTAIQPVQSSEWRARADCMQLTEKLVGQLTFRRFLLWKMDTEDRKYLRTMLDVIARDLLQKVFESAQFSYQSGITPVELRDFRLEFHEDTMTVVEEELVQRGLANHSSLMSNWMDVVAALSTINDTFRDRISTSYVSDLVTKERYSLFDNTSRTLSLPPTFAMLPVYRRQLSDTAKFGALGTLFATACFQVFLARLANGSAALDEALRRLRCFADSAEYRSDQLEIYHSAASFVIALDALRSFGSTDYRRLRMFDSLQAFFVLMCYLLCTPNTSDESIVSEAICNEAVKNTESFAVAFQCAPGTAMNPEKRCHFFYNKPK